MGRLTNLKNIIHPLRSLFLFAMTTCFLFLMFNSKDFLFSEEPDHYEEKRLIVTNEITGLLSNQYQVDYVGKGFRANTAYLYLRIKSNGESGIDSEIIRSFLESLNFDDRLCRNLESIILSGNKIRMDYSYDSVDITWQFPDNDCKPVQITK